MLCLKTFNVSGAFLISALILGTFKRSGPKWGYAFCLWQSNDLILTQQREWFEGRHVCHLCGARARVRTLLPHTCRVPHIPFTPVKKSPIVIYRANIYKRPHPTPEITLLGVGVYKRGGGYTIPAVWGLKYRLPPLSPEKCLMARKGGNVGGGGGRVCNFALDNSLRSGRCQSRSPTSGAWQLLDPEPCHERHGIGQRGHHGSQSSPTWLAPRHGSWYQCLTQRIF